MSSSRVVLLFGPVLFELVANDCAEKPAQVHEGLLHSAAVVQRIGKQDQQRHHAKKVRIQSSGSNLESQSDIKISIIFFGPDKPTN